MLESFRLEKAFRIMRSKVPHPHVSEMSVGMGTPAPPWAAWSNADHTLHEEILPDT